MMLTIKNEERFLFTSERSGYRHVYCSNYAGEFTQLTKGDWEVTSILGFDEARGWVYFNGKRNGPHNSMLYRYFFYYSFVC
jgi:dipeptidyl-peptidase-4